MNASAPIAYPEPRSLPSTILLVDDEPNFREVVGEILRMQGLRVIVATSVADALTSMRVSPPDLVLTDLMMPDVDGLSFVRMIRSTPAWERIPVIMLTARSTESDLYEATMAGATSLLSKPFSAAELRRAIAPYVQAPTGTTAAAPT